ncbi:hypothetical protein M0R04_14540 [Candidatus Dojkabacteria bacterium]|jgi:uncharacterized protein (UPF0210 family)|nr:hypothetical protein [Candidatus Dojkabacteria bacterium]
MADEELTKDEIAELQSVLGGAPRPDEKHNVHKFLDEVAKSDDTTKTGFLSIEELGKPINPARTHKRLALISKDILDNPYFTQHFLNEAEITTSTSLSKEAKLITLAVTTTKQIADITKVHKPNKGWFKKKEPEESEGST